MHETMLGAVILSARATDERDVVTVATAATRGGVHKRTFERQRLGVSDGLGDSDGILSLQWCCAAMISFRIVVFAENWASTGGGVGERVSERGRCIAESAERRRRASARTDGDVRTRTNERTSEREKEATRCER